MLFGALGDRAYQIVPITSAAFQQAGSSRLALARTEIVRRAIFRWVLPSHEARDRRGLTGANIDVISNHKDNNQDCYAAARAERYRMIFYKR
jgi:hypothetical protein